MKQVLEQIVRFRVWLLLKMFCQGFFLISEGFASAILFFVWKQEENRGKKFQCVHM
jgi:hypothetical protein